MTKREYYKKELNNVENDGNITIKLTSLENSTKEININLDSVKEIKNFINRLERKLVKEEIHKANFKLQKEN